MATSEYYELLRRVRQLTSAEQLRLLEDLASLLRRQILPQRRQSILDLQGLGKHVWANVNVQAYVDEERDSWNG